MECRRGAGHRGAQPVTVFINLYQHSRAGQAPSCTGSSLQEPWPSLFMYGCLKLNPQSYKQWPSLPFDRFQKAWKSVISGASKWIHVTLQCFVKIATVMLHIALSNISCPGWPHLGISLYKQSLNGIAKGQEGSRMNSAAGFSEGNGEQWRQHCLASLNSAILCAPPLQESCAFAEGRKTNTSHVYTEGTWLTSNATCAKPCPCLQIRTSETSIQSHSHQMEQHPPVRI